MRKTFVNTLVELAEQDSRIILLTGDLGYTVLEPFQERFPDRFYNIGVAEQNMVGIATGLAEAGFLPFVYSIVTFASLRPYEFIRNGPILHQLPVRIVAVGGGFEYGAAGLTHHGLDDIGVMRVQPGLTVLAPADFQQARAALLETWNISGPVYYRLGKDDRTTVRGLEGRFRLGQVEIVREGRDLLLVAMGSIAREVVEAADQLSEQGIDAMVVLVASINPLSVEGLSVLLERFPLTLTIEAHYINGGVGSIVSEVMAAKGIGGRVVRLGVNRLADGISGSEPAMLQMHGLDSVSIAQQAAKELQMVGVDGG